MDKLLTPGSMLGNLPLIKEVETFSISPENPDGKKGGGAREIPGKDNFASRMGKGWKVRPYVKLYAGKTFTVADITGPAVIQHIWCTVSEKAYRNCILRFYWDEEKSPSVEVPLGDFFANGHGLRYPVNSLPICSNSTGGFNSYWQMPFKKRCVITLESQHNEDIDGFYYEVTFARGSLPDNVGTFHAQWKRATTDKKDPQYTILDNVKGQGQYVGTFLAWTQLNNDWWGEGEIKFYIDGDKKYPTICGTGTEDYFGGAWCFTEGIYNTPFLGYPLRRAEAGEVPRHALYRWHIADPVYFKKDLKVTIQTINIGPDNKFQPICDDIASMACWYQTEPHESFPAILSVQERWSR